MFFVIVGIVILFASLLIALFSLVRELDRWEEPYLAPSSKDISAGEPFVEQGALADEPVPAYDENQDEQQAGLEATTAGTLEPFPWEMSGQDDLGLMESARDEMLDEAGGGQGHGILSGEISVRDLQQRKID